MSYTDDTTMIADDEQKLQELMDVLRCYDLIAPEPSSMCKLMSICYVYTVEYNILFNPLLTMHCCHV